MAELAVEEQPHAVPRVVAIISSLLQQVADHNDISAACGRLKKTAAATASAFEGTSKPSISVRSYLERIFRYANCSSSCYVIAYIYLDRFLRRQPAVAVDSFNVHRFIITSVLVAVKFMDDIYYNNAYYAKVGGISLMEMNYMELDFLFGVGFELNVTPDVFASYCSIMQAHTHVECPPAPRMLLCSSTDEEPGNCQQMKQMSVREVYGT